MNKAKGYIPIVMFAIFHIWARIENRIISWKGSIKAKLILMRYK